MNKINNLPVYEWGAPRPESLKRPKTLYREGLRMIGEPAAILRAKGGAEYYLYDDSKTEPITVENVRPEERSAFNKGLRERKIAEKKTSSLPYPEAKNRSLFKKNKKLLSKSVQPQIIEALNLPIYSESELPGFLYPPGALLTKGFNPNGGPAGVLKHEDGHLDYVYYGIKEDPIKKLVISDLRTNPDKYVILDTETTGYLEDDEIIQLTCLDLMGNVLYDGYFNPVKSSCWGAVKKHKLSKKFLATQPFWQDEWEKINGVLKGKIILAHNADFDKRLIQQTCQRYGVEFNYISDYCCTMSFLKLKTGKASLEKALTTLGHDFEEENLHNARTDCFMLLKALLPTQDVFKLQAQVKRMFDRVCEYKRVERREFDAFEAGWQWISNTFNVSDRYQDFKVLDLKTCQSIIESLEDITHKLNLVNFM